MLLRHLLFLVLLICAGQSSAGVYHVSGRVTRADHLTPIAGADVALYTPGFILPNLVARTTTDASGNYTLSAECDDRCYLAANLAPYFEERQNLPATAGAVQINFALAHPAAISGQVAAGSALAHVNVEACRDLTGNGKFTDCSHVALDIQGQYQFSGLLPGNYRLCTQSASSTLRMQCYDHQDAPAMQGMQQFEIVVLGDGQSRTGIDFDLNPGATIAGHVRDALTNEVIPASIEIYDANGELLVVYFGDGDYQTGGLAPGTYYVRAATDFGIFQALPSGTLYGAGACNLNCVITSGTPITLTAGEAISGIDFAIAPRAIIRGTVRDATTQQPLAGVTVRQLRLLGIGIPNHLTTTTAADGTYRFYASPGAFFRVHTDGTPDHVGVIWPDLPCPHDCDWRGEEVTVGEGSDTTFDFNLAHGGVISGTIDAVTPGSTRFSLFSAVTGGRLWDHRADASGGSYATPAILPGVYFLSAENNDACQTFSGYACTSYSGPQSLGTVITVSAGQTTSGVDFVLDGDIIFSGRFDH